MLQRHGHDAYEADDLFCMIPIYACSYSGVHKFCSVALDIVHAIFASVAEEEGGNVGDGPVVGEVVEVRKVGGSAADRSDSAIFFWKRH